MSTYENWESVKAEFEKSETYRRMPVQEHYGRNLVEWLAEGHHPPVRKSDISMDGLVIDRKFMEITFPDGRKFTLQKKVFHLLEFLAANHKRVLGRDEILRVVWGSDVVVLDRTIDVQITKIRNLLGHESIITLKGIGYRFNREGCSF
jgi:two-component system alkaline phosphatase synthesis response regulator PhoP